MKCNNIKQWGNMMNTNCKRYAMIGLVIVGMAMTGCGGDGDVTTDAATAPTATPIPLGDDTATELADDVIDGGNDVTESPFMKLWAATAFTTIDDCFDGCDTEYPDIAGAKSDDNLDCVAQCKIEYPE